MLMDIREKFSNLAEKLTNPSHDNLSTTSKPKKSLASLLTPRNIIIFAAILFVLVAVIITGSLLNNVNRKEQDLTVQLSLRCDNLTTTLKKYNRHLKSPALRSLGSSFSGNLQDLKRQLSTIIANDFKVDPKKINEKLLAEENSLNNDLNQNLESARLNNILDRSFAHNFALQIVLIQSIESEIMARTHKAPLQEATTKSHASLEVLHQKLSTFSEN